MKRSIVIITFFVLFVIVMLLIPNIVKAETIQTVYFDYSKIQAVGGESPKLYELDSEVGEILSQSWTDVNGSSVTEFIVGKEYKYNAILKFKDVVNVEVINGPDIYESFGVQRDWNDDTILHVEFKITVPKPFTVKINAPESVHLGVANEFTTYEMKNETIKFTLDDGCKIIEVKVNGIEVLGDVNIDDSTWARYLSYNNEINVSNIGADIVIDIKATVSKKQTINLIAEVPKVGDLPEDFSIQIDNKDYNILYVEWVGLIEDERMGYIVEHIEGAFEFGKTYGLEIVLETNLSAISNDITIIWGEQESEAFIDNGQILAGFLFNELEEKNEYNKEDNKVDDKIDNNLDNTENKVDNNDNTSIDDTSTETTNNTLRNNNPQTGDNITLSMGIFVISIIGILATTKLKKHYKNK